MAPVIDPEVAERIKDQQRYAEGFRYKTIAWVHPRSGDDYSIVLYTKAAPTHKQMNRELRRSLVKTDWTTWVLTEEGSKGMQQAPAAEPATPRPEPSVGPNNSVTDFPGEPEEEPEDDDEQCYLVVCTRGEEAEILAVVAPASRFARRAAKKEWQNLYGNADDVEFNARHAGPNWHN